MALCYISKEKKGKYVFAVAEILSPQVWLSSKFRSEKVRGIDSEEFLLFRGKNCSVRGIPCVSE